jgi:hypothetical protein
VDFYLQFYQFFLFGIKIFYIVKEMIIFEKADIILVNKISILCFLKLINKNKEWKISKEKSDNLKSFQKLIKSRILFFCYIFLIIQLLLF